MKLTENGQSIGRALSDSPLDATSSLVMMIVENKERTITISGIEGLALLDSSSTPPTTTVRDSLASRIAQGFSVVKEYVAVTVRGVRGYFDELYATMIHTDTLCVGSTCVTESQLQQLLQQSNVAPSPSPVPPSDGGGVVAGTTTDEGSSTEGNNGNGTTTTEGLPGGEGDSNGTTTDNGSVSGQGDAGLTTGGDGEPFLDPGSASGDWGSTETSLTP
jgi:hypothetical protein